MKKLDVLISTCNDGIFSAIAVPVAPNCQVGYVIVHQQFSGFDKKRMLAVYRALSLRPDIKLVESKEAGLSKSRNLALASSDADYVLLCDDDVVLMKDFHEKILHAYEEFNNASIMAFKTRRIGAQQKTYPQNPKKLSFRNIFSVSSIEISIALSDIKKASVRFDEHFGLGASYPVGEENIFLADAYRKGLCIVFYPATVASHDGASSGSLWGSANMRARGALFRRIFGIMGIPLLFVYLLKHVKHILGGGLYHGVIACLIGFFGYSKDKSS